MVPPRLPELILLLGRDPARHSLLRRRGVRHPPRGLELRLRARDGCDFLGSETAAQLLGRSAQPRSPAAAANWGGTGLAPGGALAGLPCRAPKAR